ncbi:MAG: DUF2793 domain-containing protein [Paracoccaceae bacterium]
MTENSPRLNLPYLQPSQAQKHVTHNEALRQLDAIVQVAIEAVGAETPPTEPGSGAMFALGSEPQGLWAGQAGTLALWDGVAWQFVIPGEGWRGFDKGAGVAITYHGGEWHPEEPDFQNLSGVGIGTGSDVTNRLAVASQASLFTHSGAGHQVKVNKAANGDTASLLFQSGWTGHAEMGLTGDTAFSIKVSADGGAWQQALRLDPTEARIDVPVTGASVQTEPLDTTAGRLLINGAFGFGATPAPVPGNDLDAISVAGSYLLDTATLAGSALPASGVSAGANLLHIQQDASNGAQLLVGDGRCFIRSRVGGHWQDWNELFSQAQNSVLGAVSMNAGRPTGAVIERGSSAQGDFVRFADGTQICTFRENTLLTLSQGGVSDHVWTYPAGFAVGFEDEISLSVTPERATSANGSIPAICMAAYRNDCSATQAAFGLTNLNAVADFSYVVTAIGRWI